MSKVAAKNYLTPFYDQLIPPMFKVQVLLKEFLYCYFSHQLLIDFCVFEQKVITESDFIWLIYLIGGKILMREFHLETYSQFSLDVLVKPNQRKIFHHKSKKILLLQYPPITVLYWQNVKDLYERIQVGSQPQTLNCICKMTVFSSFVLIGQF